PERAGWQSRIVELLGQGVHPRVPRQTVFLGKRPRVPMTFSWIPPGTFLMGSPPEEVGRRTNETRHRVTLTKGFWLGVYPVTQEQWGAVMGRTPSRFKGEGHPVENVTWGSCQEFCDKLGEGTGERVRLPTEAEWEWGCRAGTTTPFFVGDTISTEQANYD